MTRIALGAKPLVRVIQRLRPTDAEQFKPARRRTLGLRGRVMAAFTLGAMLLSTFLSVSTYVIVRHTLVEQRENLTERQTFVNARLVRNGLRTTRTDVPQLLSSLENPTGSEAVLLYQGNWFASDSLKFNQSLLPEDFKKTVMSGTPARMRFKAGGSTYLAMGIPVPTVSASYYEINTLSDLNRTLSILAGTLAVASLVSSLGGMALGRWASRLVLRPVIQAAGTAETISQGNMAARLKSDGDADLDRLVLSFNSMVDALQRRIQRDARFASDVSHELRSPLMTLASAVSVLQARREDLPERSQTVLDLLAKEIERFQRMVQDLLEISRSDAGHVDVTYETVRLGEFMSRVVEASGQPIPIDISADVADVVLEVDKRRMEQVLANLMQNADRYAGGVSSIALRSNAKHVTITVDDAGPGVPIEERERIFERFARGRSAKSRARSDGTGLGLSLVDEHVRLHGGRVWVEDAPSGGARFVVELPITR